jgi:hypothetical protein
MKSVASVSILACLLFLSACATHTDSTTPVRLIVSSTTASGDVIADLRKTTLAAIRAQAPNARPLTIALNVDVATMTGQQPFIIQSQSSGERPIPPVTYSPTEGQATVSVNHSAFDMASTEEIEGFRVSYTISDAAGRVVESNRLTFEHDYLVNAATGKPVYGSGRRSHFLLRRDPVRDTARFLASRAKTLSE